MPVALIGAAIGGIQAIAGGIKKRKAERALEAQANSFQPNQGILDYYNKALSKYSANPYTSNSYQQQTNQIQRNLAGGITASQNKRLGLGAIAGQVQQANDAAGRAVVNSENIEAANLGRLGQASQMKATEQQKKFDMLYNLKAQKAGQAASLQNTGISNLYSGISAYAAGMDGTSGLNAPVGSRSYNKAWDKKYGDIFS